MTTIRDKFEAAILNGRSRDNILVSSQLHLGADGEYFNANTQALFNFYRKGWEDACANAAEDVEAPSQCAEPIGPTHNCNWEGPLSSSGDSTCSVCGHEWEFPF